MGKRLSDIENTIRASEGDFFDYLKNTLNPATFDFVESLSRKTDLIIFSGVIRNFFLDTRDIRDLDIVVSSELELENFIVGHQYRRNSFGGYKIFVGDISIDAWAIEKTYAFNIQKALPFKLEEIIHTTSFFNFSSIVYFFNSRRFLFSKKFVKFLKDRTLNYDYLPNANYPLCVVNTFYYADKYNLKIDQRLLHFLRKCHPQSIDNYSSVQEKHFGAILYNNQEIEKRLYH